MNSNRHSNYREIENNQADLRHYGFSYSKARSGFATKKVKSTTVQQLNSEKYENDASEDFTSIKQLLIDIIVQDSTEWMKVTESGDGTPYHEFKQSSKKYRFEKAFNDFFDTVKFKGIDNTNTEEISIRFALC